MEEREAEHATRLLPENGSPAPPSASSNEHNVATTTANKPARFTVGSDLYVRMAQQLDRCGPDTGRKYVKEDVLGSLGDSIQLSGVRENVVTKKMQHDATTHVSASGGGPVHTACVARAQQSPRTSRTGQYCKTIKSEALALDSGGCGRPVGRRGDGFEGFEQGASKAHRGQ
jgi:hypothetical protein